MTERSESSVTVEASRQQIKDRIGRLFFDPDVQAINQQFPEIKNSWQQQVPKTLSKYPGLAEVSLINVASNAYRSLFDNKPILSYSIRFYFKVPAHLSSCSASEINSIGAKIKRIDFSTALETEITERKDCKITRIDDSKNAEDEIKRNEIVCELLDLLLSDQERLSAQD